MCISAVLLYALCFPRTSTAACTLSPSKQETEDMQNGEKAEYLLSPLKVVCFSLSSAKVLEDREGESDKSLS
jgi:hypothetical protein